MNKEAIKEIHVKYINSMNELASKAKDKIFNNLFKEIDIIDFIDDPEAFSASLADTFKILLNEYLEKAMNEGETLSKEIVENV